MRQLFSMRTLAGPLLAVLCAGEINAQPPTGGGTATSQLPPSRRQLHPRNIQKMPTSRRNGALDDSYRVLEGSQTPRRRIVGPGYSSWQLGVSSEDAPMGLRIQGVENWSPAYYAGLEMGDYLLDVNGYPIGSYSGGYFPLQAAFSALADPEGWVELGVWNRRTRREEYMWVQLTHR
ncbi:MAG TPA: hypothetical protein VIY86_03905 [Pirellulaceae bacterium]